MNKIINAEKTNTEEVKDFRAGFLTLPFNQEQFAEFITSLLGSPQKITKRIKGNFEIHLTDLQQFYNLINQRITQQNHGKLLQFKTKIYYNDDSSVQLGSYNELVSYNEVKPVISDAVKMTWTYLIQFADKKVPEKQEIELMIISAPIRNVLEDDDVIRIFPTFGEFRISISHTARSWGSDIESLLTNQINSLMTPCEKWKEFIRKKSGWIGILVGLLFVFSTLTSIYLTAKDFSINEINNVNESLIIYGGNIAGKIDFISKYIASNSQNFFLLKSLLFIVSSIFGAILLGIWVENLADNRIRSFIVLTSEANKKMKEYVRKHDRNTILFFVSLVLSIVCGVISNYLFIYLTGN